MPRHLYALGIRGYSGRPIQEVVAMLHQMLCFGSLKTLEYYCSHPDRYPWVGVTVEQLRRNYQPDLAVALGNMAKRPYDNSRWPKRHVGSSDDIAQRFDDGFGVLVSGDFIGGYVSGAYGGIDTAAIFVDHGHHPPYIRATFYKKGVKDVAAIALEDMVSHWERNGHHESVWRKPIQEFRSDSGSFTSEATESLCKHFKIIQSFSTPGSQGQNPAEATIRRIFELMTSCYSNAMWVPRTLWTYCLAYVCNGRNLKVTDLESGPSWEAFHGKFYDFNSCPLLPFGQPVVVFIDKPQRVWKFGPHAFLGMYVGTPEGIKNAIMVFNPVTGRVRVSRDYMIADVSAVPAYWPRYTDKDGNFLPVENDPTYPNADEDGNLPLVRGDPMGAAIEEVPYAIPIAVHEEHRPLIEEVGIAPAAPIDDDDADAITPIVGRCTAELIPLDLQQETKLDTNIIEYGDITPEIIDFSMEAIFLEELDNEVEFYVRKLSGMRRPIKSKKWLHDTIDKRDAKRLAQRKFRSLMGQLKRNGKAKVRSVDNPSLKKALDGPYRQQVLDAMKAELDQYTETYGVIDIFSNEHVDEMSKKEKHNAITSHFEITYKRDKKTGALEKVKARLCIHGNQEEKYEWDNIKSPTARSASVKLIMALLAKKISDRQEFSGRAYDVPGAFLQSDIEESNAAKYAKDPNFVPAKPIVIRLPDGRYGRLTAYAYGLKQASFEFYLKCKQAMETFQFVSTSDPCLFVRWVGDEVIIAAVHVDDFFVISTSTALHNELDQHFSKLFGERLTRKSGEEIAYQGMVVQRQSDGSVFVSQPSYVKDKIIEEWAYAKGLVNRADPGVKDHPMQATQAHAEGDDELVDPTLFRGVVGAISYLAQMTRPDLLYSVSVVASKSNNPTQYDLRSVKRILRYIIGTADYGLHFCSDSDFQLVAYADASFASRDLSRSQSGYCFSLGRSNAMFYARSSKQTIVTLSSTEAEYVSLFHCSTEVVFLRRLLEELGFRQETTIIFQDNISTIHWSLGRNNFHKTKHMDVKYHYVRQLVTDSVLAPEYLPTAQMIADVLTKPVLKDQFQQLSWQLLGYHI